MNQLITGGPHIVPYVCEETSMKQRFLVPFGYRFDPLTMVCYILQVSEKTAKHVSRNSFFEVVPEENEVVQQGSAQN